MSRSVLIVAGEVSGDLHAAEVIREARKRCPQLRFRGIAGERMRKAGVEAIEQSENLAVMGIGEVLRRYRFLRGVFRRVLAEVDRRPPDAALLVDYPGFNLRLAEELKRRGVKVLYYISPKVWAWNARRIPRMARVIDRLMVIFPFEPAVFAGTGLRVDYVGNPLVGQIRSFLETAPAPLPWDEGKRIALLPGSRRQEIERIWPVMLEAAALLEREIPAAFIAAPPNEEIEQQMRGLLEWSKRKPSRLRLVRGAAREALRQAEAALVTSGTATLEAALIGTPHVLVYRTSLLTYLIGRRLVKVPFIGLVNIIAGEAVTPELIQQDASPEKMAAALRPLLADTPQRKAMLAGFDRVRRLLGDDPAAKRVAEIVCAEAGAASSS